MLSKAETTMNLRKLSDALGDAEGDPYTDDASPVVIEIDGARYGVTGVMVQTEKHRRYDTVGVPVELALRRIG